MTSRLKFQSCLYRTEDERNAAIAAAWMDAGGLNSSEQIDEFLADGYSPAAAARECIAGWGLNEATDEEDVEPYITEAALTEAMEDFFRDRPDREAGK
jgi:hypothetical protein